MAIPTRFNMGQVQGSGADYFLRLLQEQGGAGARPSASITGGLPTARRGTPIPLMRKRPPMPQIGLRGIRDISALPAGGGMTSLQRDLAAKMGLGAQKPETPKAPPSLMDRLTPAVGTPAFAGLSKAAATGLQLSGYQDKPITTGAGLGAMFGAGMEAYTAEKKEQAAAELAKQQRETDIALKMMEIRATQGKQATKEGLDTARLRRDLRKDFNDSSKYFNEAKQFWTDVVNFSKPEQSSAADLALVFSYMKMLDPASVVREGEQMQVKSLGGIGAEARSFLSRLGITQEGTYEGGLLIIDPTVREEIRQASASRFADLVKGQVELEQFTADEGARAGLTPDFFKSNLSGEGTLKRPYIVQDLSELPNTAKDGDYAIVNGVFQKISEQS